MGYDKPVDAEVELFVVGWKRHKEGIPASFLSSLDANRLLKRWKERNVWYRILGNGNILVNFRRKFA